MKLSFSAALALASVVTAKTVYVTEYHITTVNGAVGTTQVGLQTEGEQTPTTQQTPTTLVTKTSSTSSKPATTSTDEPAASSSSSSDDPIYADIAKSSGLDATFAKNILDAHNEKRALHLAGKLSWDKDVYEYAQAYADKYDCSGQLTHSGGEYGENLAVGYSDGVSALDAWYAEGDNFDYNSGSTYDHFTQVVWKDTTKLGCAIKDCSAKNWGHYIICSYDPSGNMVGETKANVLPPQ
ncbi:hypothetical protein QFC19_007932 [Naganishia cerealis]|jgi:pathogenesis-related protein 1|uniref:Uncharacterized protein n=1 Tax=Naganishia cerealis TaxID=610337 RepID=A0ACC2V5I4_9TREE|nr:hypothetical protein QFC19_007932 [Naganishia cerealis]